MCDLIWQPSTETEFDGDVKDDRLPSDFNSTEKKGKVRIKQEKLSFFLLFFLEKNKNHASRWRIGWEWSSARYGFWCWME